MKKIFVILTGLLFVGIGIFLLVNGNAKNKRCTVETIGTVTEIKEDRSTDSNGDYTYTYYPIITYEVGEKVITKQSNIGTAMGSNLRLNKHVSISSEHSKYSVNDKIDILYNPDNVEEFIIKGETTNSTNFIGIISIVLGSLAAILGVIRRIE